MKLFITGAGGFVGSVLLTKLPKEYEIVCLGHSTNYDKLKQFIGSNVKLVEGDISDESLVDELMKDVDVVIHLVGIGGTPVCLKDPVNAILTNVQGTNILVNSAIKNNVKKFIFTSTYIAYSVFEQRELPFMEEMKLKPDDFYGSLKAVAESSVMNLPNFVILRLSTIYGYGLGFGSSLNALTMNLIKSAHDNGIIKFKGSGNAKFDLLHVDDLCEAIKLILNKDIKNEVINLGSGKPLSINELSSEIVDVFRNEFDKNVKIVRLEDENYKEWPDHWMSIDKAKKLLDWEPNISLQEGIGRIIQKIK
jgi:nucleoside-diphosphate-sugar epimerase